MLKTIKLRLFALGGAIAILGGLIGWAAYTSAHEVASLQEHFSTRHLRSFEIADHVQSTVLQLNNSIINYELKRDPTGLKKFLTTSAALNVWIDEQKHVLVSPREREVLDLIDTAYDGFLGTATNEVSRASKTRSDSELVLGHVSDVVKASLSMLELGYKLEDAHRQSLEQLLVDSQQSVSRLQRVIFLSLFLLLASVIWSSVTVYREMITPLQRKLVASDAIIARQEKLAALGMLAAGVAHEIRNPLTAIKARLFTLQHNLQSAELEDARVIGNEINRLERIVKAVLQFARPAEPVFETVPIHAILGEVVQLLAPELQKKGIQLTLQEVDPSPVKIDAEQIKQVLINLIQNASESITGKGTIMIRARKGNDVLSGRYSKTVCIQVEDTGKGISPDVEKRLFDPFFTTKEGGTGLGLAIAARIIEKHSGELQHRAQHHHGATFSIVLPTAHDN